MPKSRLTLAAQLERLLPAAARDIRRRVLQRRFNPMVPALDVELHFDGRQSRFLVYEMDGKGNQFSVERDGAVLLGDVRPALSKGLRFADVELEELEAPLVRWFRKAWARAGGARFPLRTTLRVHDGVEEHVLTKGTPRSSGAAPRLARPRARRSRS
ncbi:MAG TPA: hypothetical protein VN903_40210 [Polyangia bacterium]|jgi:hypothetical protein|nr:hypothetical protein [Polyangia bacterium]